MYLNEKRDRLLVIARGQPIPVIRRRDGGGEKSNRGHNAEIKTAVQRDGFYWRKLRNSNSLPSKKPASPFTARRPRRNDNETSGLVG